jgi:hypothetical protein
MPQASPHFSFAELTRTNPGLANDPGVNEGAALVRLAELVLEPMRALAGPLHVNCGYRSPEVNTKVGGVANSQHLKGEAADLSPRDITTSALFDLTRKSEIPFDQLILEFGWVHVSTAPLGRAPRRQALRARKTLDGKVHYDPVSQ